VAAGSSLVVAPAGAAQSATSYGCSSWIPGSWANYAIASCDGGTGTYRAVAYCRTSAGAVTVRFGAWTRPVAGSYAYCASTERIFDDAIQTSS
jgi:hypothetical protein